MHITSCSRDSRDCRDSRETLKYSTFGREKFGFRAMSRRIWKLCVASLLIILCFRVRFPTLLVSVFDPGVPLWTVTSRSVSYIFQIITFVTTTIARGDNPPPIKNFLEQLSSALWGVSYHSPVEILVGNSESISHQDIYRGPEIFSSQVEGSSLVVRISCVVW